MLNGYASPIYEGKIDFPSSYVSACICVCGGLDGWIYQFKWSYTGPTGTNERWEKINIK